MHDIDSAISDKILDCFTLTPTQFESDTEIIGRIKKADKDWIYLCISDEYSLNYVKAYCKEVVFDITFHINRTPFQIQHLALQYMQEHNLFPILINNPSFVNKPSNLNTRALVAAEEELSEQLNHEQQIAVENITTSTNTEVPYVLFGPAGTGKTRTLCIAIKKIIQSSSDKYILVCASTNTACDEISLRLSKILDQGKVFRLYARSHNAARIDERIKPFCNYMDQCVIPPLKFLYQFRVLVCTLSTSASLTRSRKTDITFQSDHFSHVIIDECASSHETNSMIPIAGIVFFSFLTVHIYSLGLFSLI